MNMAPIQFCGVPCYPIFPCFKQNENNVDYEDDKTFEAMSILQNFSIPDNLIYYLQRETLGFQAIIDANFSKHNLARFDEYGDVVDQNLKPIDGKTIFRPFIKESFVIDSPSIIFTFPKLEHFNSDYRNLKAESLLDNSSGLKTEDFPVSDKICFDYRKNDFSFRFGFPLSLFGISFHKYKRYSACLLWSFILNYKHCFLHGRHKSEVLDDHIGPKPKVKYKGKKSAIEIWNANLNIRRKT